MTSALGSRRVKHRRSKAHPDEFPDAGPVEIPKAYEDLTPAAFAVWMRLHCEPIESLRAGRMAMATTLGYSERQSDEILRELTRKNYINVVSGKCGNPTAIVINRRCQINSRVTVVRLSNVLAPDVALSVTPQTITIPVSSVGSGPNVLTREQGIDRSVEVTTNDGLFNILSWISRRLKFVSEDSYIERTQKTTPREEEGKGTFRRVGEKVGSDPLQGSSRTQDERSESVKPCGLTPASATRSGGINLDRMRESKRDAFARSKAARAEDRANHKARAEAQGREPGSVNWSKLDQLGKPVVSFDPGHPSRGRTLAVLQSPPRSKERRALVEKIGTEFSRIYERYRRDAERRRGNAYATYSVEYAERKHCEEAGVICMLRGVTPRQLLEYWDKNIKHFTDGNLIIPPLTFLKSANNIDRVATSAIGTLARTSAKTDEEPSRIRATDRNTFSGPNGLDVRLRSALERAGFQTQMYNDRYLLSIQHNALSIARGKSIFLAEGKVRRMSDWAARHLYQKAS